MTRIRIATDGTVGGLWSDEIDWSSLGRVSVDRASHVEFSGRRQLWYVRDRCARHALRAVHQFVLRRPLGDVLYWSGSRREALAWECDYFSPGGPGWASFPTSRRKTRAGGLAAQKEERPLMERLKLFFAFLPGGRCGRQRVSDHQRRQAYGPRWTLRRRRHIASYRRRRARTPRRRPREEGARQ